MGETKMRDHEIHAGDDEEERETIMIINTDKQPS